MRPTTTNSGPPTIPHSSSDRVALSSAWDATRADAGLIVAEYALDIGLLPIATGLVELPSSQRRRTRSGEIDIPPGGFGDGGAEGREPQSGRGMTGQAVTCGQGFDPALSGFSRARHPRSALIAA